MSLTPKLVIDGVNAEHWGIAVDEEGKIVFLVCDHTEGVFWQTMTHIPPKLLAYVDTFMAQHYHLLDNRLGIPAPEIGMTSDGEITQGPTASLTD